jgi:hypothetical protein
VQRDRGRGAWGAVSGRSERDSWLFKSWSCLAFSVCLLGRSRHPLVLPSRSSPTGRGGARQNRFVYKAFLRRQDGLSPSSNQRFASCLSDLRPTVTGRREFLGVATRTDPCRSVDGDPRRREEIKPKNLRFDLPASLLSRCRLARRTATALTAATTAAATSPALTSRTKGTHAVAVRATAVTTVALRGTTIAARLLLR